MKFYLFLLFLIQLKCTRSENAKNTKNSLDLKSSLLWTKGDLLAIKKDDIVKTVIDFPMMLIFHTDQQNQSQVYVMNLTYNQDPCKAAILRNGAQIVDASVMNRKGDSNIITVAYPDHIEVFSLHTKRTISGESACKQMELLQKISFKAKIRSTSLVNKRLNHKSTVFMIVSKKSFKQGNQISVFQWMSSGFHETHEETLGHIIKVSTLTLKPCNRPLILVASTINNSSGASVLLVFDINPAGKLVLQQKLFLNFKYLEPYMLDCNNYNFLMCRNNVKNKNDCLIYKSEADHIEFMEEGKLNMAVAKQGLAYTEGLGILWNPRRINTMIAFSDATNLIEFTASNNTNADLININLSGENSTYLLLLVYKSQNALSIEMNELAYVENLQISARDLLEDIVQRIRDLIYSRKLLYDKIATATRDKTNEIRMLDLDKIQIENGNIFKLLINDTVISRPSHIHSKLDVTKKRVRKDQVRNIRKHIYVKKLMVHNLNYNKSLYYDIRKNDSTQLIFNSNPVISSDQIYAKKVKALQQPMIASNQDSGEHISHMKLFKNIKIDKITVQQINNISIVELYDKAFLRHRDTSINGSLKVHIPESGEKRISIDHLTAEVLNQRRINDFFTLRTDQEIESNIFVSKFLVSNISTGTLNSIDVSLIALTTSDNTISSPIRIENFTVSGDLVLSDENEANFADQVRMASKPVKFSQFYYGQVNIKGRLVLNDLIRTKSAKSSRFMRIDSSAHQTTVLGDLGEYFWMKNTAQKFNKPVHLSMPANVYKLNVTTINGELLSNFLFRSSNAKLVGPLLVENIRIAGNLENDFFFKERRQGSFRIEELNSNLVYRNVEANEIFGRKTFSSPLKVWNLLSKTFPTSEVADLVHTANVENLVYFPSSKRIQTLHVTQSFLVADEIEMEEYNGENLSNFLKMATLRTQKLVTENLRFVKRVDANNLNVNYMNQLRLPKLDDAEKNFNFGTKVIIKGNAAFRDNLKIKKLNHVDWREYFTILVFRDKDTQNVGGNKQYLAPVTVSSAITATELNNYRIDKIYQGALRKVGSQTITAPWKFQNLAIEKFLTKSTIQNVDANLLVRTDANMKIHGNLKIRTTRLRGSLFGITGVTSAAYELLSRLRRVDRLKWDAIHIRGIANWPKLDPVESLDYDFLHNFAVRCGSTQTIEGKVHFKFSPKFLFALTKYDLAGIDINKIVADSLVRNPRFEKIILGGSKYFEMPLELSDSVQLKQGLNTEVINGFDILDLNQTFYRKDEYKILHGHKSTPMNAQIGNLIVKGLINSVEMNQLVFITSTPSIFPAVKFTESKFSMTSLEIVRVNQLDFPAFLDGRVRVTGQKQIISGSLTFDSLRLNKGFFSKINGCTLDRIVFKQLKNHQIINGLKKFSKPLVVIGPSSMLNVNSVELIQTYETNLHSNRNYKFKKLKFPEEGTAVFQKGLNVFGGLNSNGSDGFDYIHQPSQLLNQMKKASAFELVEKHTSRILYLDLDNSLDRTKNYKNRSTILDVIEFLDPCSNTSSLYSSPADFHSQGFKITILNNCSVQKSEIRIDFNETQHVIQVPKAIENVQLLSSAAHQYPVYMVVYFQPTTYTKLISTYRIDISNATITQIQDINRSNILGSKVSSQLFEMSGEWILFLAADKLDVFSFNPDLEQFLERSSHELTWDHVEFLPAATENATYQLIVANEGDRFITVYMGDENSKFEEINIPHPLKSFSTFHDRQSGEMLMVILMQDSSFYLFKYLSNVEGWIYDARGMITDPVEISICKTRDSIALCRIDDAVTLATINNRQQKGFT